MITADGLVTNIGRARSHVFAIRGFTRDTFAERFRKALGSSEGQAAQCNTTKHLWGDHFFDPDSNTWCDVRFTWVWVVLFLKSLTPSEHTNRLTTSECATTGKKLRRGFCRFVLGPIYKIIRGCQDGSDKRRFLETYLRQQLGIKLDIDHSSYATEVMKRAMAMLLPLPAVSALLPDSPQSWNFYSSLAGH